MSERVPDWLTPTEFDIGDIVEFDHYGSRLCGEVVRVYAARCDYHVEVDGERYSVHITADNMKKAR